MTSVRPTHRESADVDLDGPLRARAPATSRTPETGRDLAHLGSRGRAAPTATTEPTAPRRRPALSVRLEQLRAFYGDAEQVKGIDLDFHANEVTAIIGPSGCGKSTMVRCINRMHEEIPGARAEGRVLLDGSRRVRPSVDVVAVRRAIGMVFQKPNPFPTMSIFDNVAAGLRLSSRGRGDLHAQGRGGAAQRRASGTRSPTASTSRAPGSPAASSSACASRARSPSNPEVILMDEPCSALDPIATLKIEELIERAQAAGHDRDRHPQHAAGRARRRPHRLHARRRSSSRSGRRRRSSPNRPTREPRNMSPASSASGDCSGCALGGGDLGRAAGRGRRAPSAQGRAHFQAQLP